MYSTWAHKMCSQMSLLTAEGATLHWIGPRRDVFFRLADLGEMMLIGKERPARVGVPAGIDCVNTGMPELHHKDCKGAVGIALLNYCASCCDVRSQNFLLIVPQALAPGTPSRSSCARQLPPSSICLTEACPRPTPSSEATSTTARGYRYRPG
jgi:hypothetical protein